MSITVGSVTIIGQKHTNRGVPCEDNSIAVEKNGVSCVVVADGAGSKQYTHARFGSKACCEAISELLTEHFDALYNENRDAAIKSLIIARIHVAFADIIKEMELESIEQLSCTLLFTAVKDRRVIAGHIGDGLIVGVTTDGLSPLTMPQNDPAGHTYFVTANHAADYLRLVKTTTDNLHAICLMTDGVQDSVYDENSGLVKPVVARMAETFSSGRESGENEIRSILEKFIVGASNTSDDSSFGVLYLDGTKAPDSSKLAGAADAFPRSEDTFKKLQEELVPQVKKARDIIVDAHIHKEINPSENEEDHVAKGKAAENEQQATETESLVEDIKAAAMKKSRLYLAIVVAELIAIIGLIAVLIFANR
ncbi:MAG: protein phosphatase 2C domain-containing protein [Clostridiales bacterium]|nr:protein phosphatase 2C domain-containing protein [Clostridiales bacterium]